MTQPYKILFAPFVPPKMIQYPTPERMPRGIILCLFKPPLFCK